MNSLQVKRFLCVLISGVMLASLAACTRSAKEAPVTDNRVAQSTPSTGAAAPPLPQPRAGEQAPPGFNTEEYGRIAENEFLAVANNPLSTFSIDVDTASYSNVRRYINQGNLPPRDAVRIEEMINYFKYDYPQPTDGQPFSISTEVAACPWSGQHRLVQVGLQGKSISLDNAPPNNLVFLIDVSGSMDSPDKLPLLKSSFRLLVNQLRPQDRVALVVYAGAAGLVLDSTPGSEKDKILAALDALNAGGSTAGGAGIKLAYEVARRNFIQGGNNRVMLATDGDFNVGVTGDGELERLIEQKREGGIFLTVLGFGTGNIKDSKMELLADKGNGHYAYIDTIHEGRRVLVNQLGGTLYTIAKDVKIQVEFNPAKVKGYRLIGYENRLLKAEDFNDDKKDAGELGAGHSVTALYEIIPAGANTKLPQVDPLKYQQKKDVKPEAFDSNEMMTVKLRYKAPAGDESRLITRAVADSPAAIAATSENLRFAAAVAEFGMLLRDSKHKGQASFQNCLALARQARGNDEDGARAEFIKLVEAGENLAPRN